MRRWLLLVLAASIAASSLYVVFRLYYAPAVSPRTGVLLTPNSAYKYNLCTEAFAFAHAAPDNPYKTDYTFHDPFRADMDTVIPHLLDYDPKTETVSFMVDVVLKKFGTFHLKLFNVHVLDGISVLIPDSKDTLHDTKVPQFIVASLGRGRVAILDYTCHEQWTWMRFDEERHRTWVDSRHVGR